jgi:hypothetical protein
MLDTENGKGKDQKGNKKLELINRSEAMVSGLYQRRKT